MLSKKISYDERIAQLSIEASLLYTWCIPHLDVEGRIYGNPEILKGTVVPYVKKLTIPKISECLKEISELGLITIYGDEHKYIQFNGFFSNQTIRKEREGKSEIPTPDKLRINSGQTPAQIKLNQININQSNINKDNI